MSASAVIPWQWAWREGVAPQLSTAGLEALQKALESDDPALIQGQNLLPPPLQGRESDQVIAACAIGFAAWKGDCPACAPLGEIGCRFAKVCYEADQRLREPGAVHYFLIQYDSWTREEMRRNLLLEVGVALAGREREPGPLEDSTRAQQKMPAAIRPPKKMAPSSDKQPWARKRKTS
jgi:hypothetical protein